MSATEVIIAVIVSLSGALVVSVSAIQAYHDVKKDALDKIKKTKELLANDKSFRAAHKKVAG